jgi:hypothetical protein
MTLDIIKNEMREITGDALERRVAQALAPVLLTGASATAVRDDARVASWRRVHVADGIELHVRDDSPAATEDVTLALREAVRTTLGRSDLR